MSNKDDKKLADDLLRGAGPVAEELLGDKKKRRTIYAMSEQEKQDLGLFYMGKLLCGLKSKMRERIAAWAAGSAKPWLGNRATKAHATKSRSSICHCPASN